MAGMFSYTKAATERAMKVQEVILRTMARKITWYQAAEIVGISDQHMRRWRERYEEFGYDGLFDRRRGKPSPKRVALAVVELVLGLYRDRYHDLDVRHFHEKLREQHQIKLSYTWVKQALQGAGLVGCGRQRGVHRKRRARRPLPGMLLHIDGSRHRWVQDERWYDLIVILDDASSEIYYEQSGSRMTGIRSWTAVVTAFGVVVKIEQVSTESPFGFLQRSHIPANANTSPSPTSKQYGCFVFSIRIHS
jgi:transposase